MKAKCYKIIASEEHTIQMELNISSTYYYYN